MKFQYPLTALLPLDLRQWLLGMELDSVVAIFKILSRLCLVAIAAVFLKLFMGAVRPSSVSRCNSRGFPPARWWP